MGKNGVYRSVWGIGAGYDVKIKKWEQGNQIQDGALQYENSKWKLWGENGNGGAMGGWQMISSDLYLDGETWQMINSIRMQT
jgi:hypothetical protein